jgi:hypothetical protein
MSDLNDLVGVYPTSLRWNAEDGYLGYSTYNSETGEREIKEIELGKPATFVIDMLTRQRGYGMIRAGSYDMRLTPVGSPAPAWPGDDEYKPAIGMWLWNPMFGEVRFETNASIARQSVITMWDEYRFESSAAQGLQPVVVFADRAAVRIKAINKSFFAPVIRIAGWIARDQVPGWREREPTVSPPSAMPILPAAPVAPALEALAGGNGRKRGKQSVTSGKAKPPNPDDPNDSIDDIFPPRK